MRIRSAQNLVAVIDQNPKYYASIRPETLQVSKMERRMRAAFRKFKSLYPDAVFPDVYFLVGSANSGGTTGPSGLLIGTEMYGKTSATALDELNPWLRAVISSVDKIPGIVAHEACHYNQHFSSAPEQRNLLGKALQEGSCDTIGELVSGQNINEHLKIYARTREKDIWYEFAREMYQPDFSKWIYNGATAKDRPADLGYYVGYRIARTYYDRAKDKRKAVRDILNIQDAQAFLRTSRYGVLLEQ